MDKKRKGALQKYHQALRTNLLVGNFLPTLRQLLTEVEYSQVKDRDGNVARVDELIEILLTKENKHFEGFCTALERNGYEHWSKKLREEVDQVISNDECGNMDKRRKDALKKYRRVLRTRIMADKIVPLLQFLIDPERSRIKNKEENAEKVDELIIILLTKENEHFETFCNVLEENGYDGCAKMLREEIDQSSVPAHCRVQFPTNDDLSDEFAILIGNLNEVVHSLPQIRLVGLIACIEEKLKSIHGPPPDPIPGTAKDLMRTASKYWDYLNIEIAQVAVKYVSEDNPDLHTRMQAYKETLSQIALEDLRNCRKKSIAPRKPPRCSIMEIIMDVNPRSYSLRRILDIKDFLLHRIGVIIALFGGWRHGSIILHFYILESDKEAAVCRLKAQKLQLKRMQVMAIKVDGTLVLSMSPNIVTEANINVSIDSVAECFDAGGNLISAMRGFGQNVGSIGTNVVQSLGGVVDEIKSIVGDSVKAALEVARTFFDKVIDVFYHGRGDSMAAAIEGLQCSPPDMQPLRSLLRQLGNALAEAAAKYSEFVGACDTAIHSCKEATDWCSEHSEGETTWDKWGRRALGGVAVAAGATAIVAGFATFGLGFVPLAAIGGGHLYGGSQILNDTPKARIRNINDTFHALNSNAYDLHSTMAPVHTTVENIVVQINSPHFSAETANIRSLQNAMKRLKTACANSYRTISRYRQQER